jgi:hypothetical protein
MKRQWHGKAGKHECGTLKSVTSLLFVLFIVPFYIDIVFFQMLVGIMTMQGGRNGNIRN